VNGGALITGVIAVGGGSAAARYLSATIAARRAETTEDGEEPDFEGPLRHFSTGYLKLERVVAWAIVAVGVLLAVLALTA